jgi:hypothetical protein
MPRDLWRRFRDGKPTDQPVQQPVQQPVEQEKNYQTNFQTYESYNILLI